MNAIPFVSKAYKHIKRYYEIVSILAKYGFGDIFSSLNLEKYVDFGRKLNLTSNRSENITKLTRWERVRRAIEELGPTFIKFGQIMSNRPDFLPEDLLTELSKLQDSIPPMGFPEIKKIIESELDDDMTSVFTSLKEECIGSASIAQVHLGILKSGEKCALKIRRPKIEKIIKIDIEIMLHLAEILEKNYSDIAVLRPVRMVEEFRRTIYKELNFSTEIQNIERFRNDFSDSKDVYIPKVYGKLSTEKLIVMEYIDGIKVSEKNKLKAYGYNLKEITERGVNLILNQIFSNGFFHADPHPGNIFVLKDNVICFLDFGMMGTLIPKHKDLLSRIIIGIANKDSRKIVNALIFLADKSNLNNINELELQIAELVDEYTNIALEKINIGELLSKFTQVLVKHRLELPPNIYLLIKALITVEGVGKNLMPEFQILDYLQPFALRLARKKLNPFSIGKRVYSSVSDLAYLLDEMPYNIHALIEQIRKPRLEVSVEDSDLEKILRTFSQISNRISFAIVIAALIIGSSFILRLDYPPQWNGVSVIGIIGFVGAGILGFWLLISIIRHGKL